MNQSTEENDVFVTFDYSPDGMLEIHSVLPDGISVGTGPFGRCLIATKAFSKGTQMYVGSTILAKSAKPRKESIDFTTIMEPITPKKDIETEDDLTELTTTFSDTSSQGSGSANHRPNEHEYLLHLYESGKPRKLIESCLLNDLNSVKDVFNPSEERRQVYGFDGFMNHSCSPNCYCPLICRTPDLMTYDAIAIKDIEIGDEITCDYALFDYECDGHQIVECGCKSANCRGRMTGFKELSLEEKFRVMEYCDKEILNKWCLDENVLILESQLPQGIELVIHGEYENSYSLAATKAFEPGEIVYKNTSVLLPNDVAKATYIIKLAGRYILLKPEEHFLFRPEYKEFVGFDTFQNHSCDPSVYQTYMNKTDYTVYAKKKILPGDLITMDYAELANLAENLENITTCSFHCTCGAKHCRGFIIA